MSGPGSKAVVVHQAYSWPGWAKRGSATFKSWVNPPTSNCFVSLFLKRLKICKEG